LRDLATFHAPDTRRRGPDLKLAALVPCLFPVTLLFPLTGCLYTTHHFNSGRILEPGNTAVTFGVGRSKVYDADCPDGYHRVIEDSRASDTHCQPYGSFEDTTPVPESMIVPAEVSSFAIPKFSLDYRLGVRGAWGPFTGVEMGWHLEAVTNPATAEFDLKFGLPIPKRYNAQHSLSAGWGVGMWADNSWFFEYAASHNLGDGDRHAVFGNYRYTILATQPVDLENSFRGWKFVSNRGHAHQVALGAFIRWPAMFLLPDYVVPEAVATFPVVAPFIHIDPSILDPFLLNFNLGFGWNF
jgi:hypothetical protein